jgi:hypothetical protein
LLDIHFDNDDPLYEQQAGFCLEVVARSLLSSPERATELFTMLLNTFAIFLSKVTEEKIPNPFVMERVVVTILRSNIHLYKIQEVRSC